MRAFAKVGPRFWQGNTGKALRKRGSEGVVMAMYLMTSPHSNMLGLYSQPMMYAAYETGLGLEGASKGLKDCIDLRFCAYDYETEMVWVFEMAKYQIAEELLPKDNRCKGIQNDYENLPECPFLGAFFDRYHKAFHLTFRRGSDEGASKAPCKQGEGEGEGEGEEKDKCGAIASRSPAPTPKAAKKAKGKAVSLSDWVAAEKAAGRPLLPSTDAAFGYAKRVNLPIPFLRLAWVEFFARYASPSEGEQPKTYVDWRAVFRRAVRENWLKLWYVEGQEFLLTSAGQQAKLAAEAQRGDAPGAAG